MSRRTVFSDVQLFIGGLCTVQTVVYFQWPLLNAVRSIYKPTTLVYAAENTNRAEFSEIVANYCDGCAPVYPNSMHSSYITAFSV